MLTRYCDMCGIHVTTWTEDTLLNGVILEKTEYHCSKCDNVVHVEEIEQPILITF